MNTPNGAADLLTPQDHNQRPIQLPKVGWGDDEDDSSFSSSPALADPPEAPIPASTWKRYSDSGVGSSSGSSSGVTLRSAVTLRAEGELQPIPEDFSMHGPWPDFCTYYDYDQDRKKAYRYRMCGRLTFKSGILAVLVFLLFVGLSIRTKRSTSPSAVASNTGNVGPPKLTKEQAEMYEVVATSFHPLWFDRSRGWNGTAYLQAFEFCDAMEKRVPCPYVAYCPLGVGYAPSGGTRGENENDVSWAPILDEKNAWVQVGSPKTCELYSTLHGNSPRWGLTGQDDEEITRNIMCCLNAKDVTLPKLPEIQDEEALGSDWLDRPPSLEEDEQGKESVGSHTLNDETQDSSNNEETESNQNNQEVKSNQVDDSQLTNSNEENTEPNQQSNDQSTANNQNEEFQHAQNFPKDPLLSNSDNPSADQITQSDLDEIVSFFEPLWFDRAYGWSGTTISEAEEFCRTKAGNRSICPYVAYCPKGPAGKVMGGCPSDALMAWAPMKEWEGLNWVGTGKENSCWHASEESEFGLDEEGLRAATGNIMCCKDKSPEADRG